MTEEQRLIEKLRKVEALFARAGTEGERLAAGHARQRIKSRLVEIERQDPAIELRFSIPDQWSQRLFVALLHRHGIEPYRYQGQRRTTIMVRASSRFIEETVWPEFEELQQTLHDDFDTVTDRIIGRRVTGRHPRWGRIRPRRRRVWHEE